MGIMSIFKPHKKYFSKSIPPKCDYCHFGKRAKSGDKILCEKSGLVDCTYSCAKFVYEPLKRIPVKQLKMVGSLADEDIYFESAYDKQQKETKTESSPSPSSKTSSSAFDSLPEPENDINIDDIEIYQADGNQYSDDEQDDIIHS